MWSHPLTKTKNKSQPTAEKDKWDSHITSETEVHMKYPTGWDNSYSQDGTYILSSRLGLAVFLRGRKTPYGFAAEKQKYVKNHSVSFSSSCRWAPHVPVKLEYMIKEEQFFRDLK